MYTEELLTTQQALDALHISRTHLYTLMKRGKIAPVERPYEAKKQVRLRFRREDVERLAPPTQRAG